MKLRDIVDSLRQINPEMTVACEHQYLPIGRLAHEAAAEIERLRKLVVEKKEDVDGRDS